MIEYFILVFIIGIVIGLAIAYLICTKQDKRTRKQNEYYRRANSNLQYTRQE